LAATEVEALAGVLFGLAAALCFAKVLAFASMSFGRGVFGGGRVARLSLLAGAGADAAKESCDCGGQEGRFYGHGAFSFEG
jgi:hypothetical protein